MRLKLRSIYALFTAFSDNVNQLPFIIAVRNGLTFLMPLLLISSFALVFMSLPIPRYQFLMSELFGPNWKSFFLYIRDGSYNILSLAMIVSVSHSFSSEFCERHSQDIPAILTSIVSVCSFGALSGISSNSFQISSLGVLGLCSAMVVTFLSSSLFLRLSSLQLSVFKNKLSGADSAYQYAMAAIIPSSVTISVFALFNHLLVSVFGITNIQDFTSSKLIAIFSMIHSQFLCAILFVFVIHLLWFFGIHGSNILEPVTQFLYSSTAVSNKVAALSGGTPKFIFTKPFFDSFVLMGGCGSCLCLLLAILIFGKHKHLRDLSKFSFVPVLFNVNELVIFGIPIVLNPVFLIPFIFVPLLFTVTSFLACFLGLVPHTIALVEWTTPIFISGYCATGSLRGVFLQLFNLVLGTICYVPFVKLAEQAAEKRIERSLSKVCKLYQKSEAQGQKICFLARCDEVGFITRALTVALEHDVLTENVSLFYQPQVDYDGHIFGLEALLRWNHQIYGTIYPPLVIALAEESDKISKLGFCITNRACSDLNRLNRLGFRDIIMSVNVSALQLEHEHFTDTLKETMAKHQVSPHNLCIEITERVALSGSDTILDNLSKIRELGIHLAMDDFGMGHSSLRYLKEYEFSSIKLDGSLIRELEWNSNCKDIISTIVSLGKSLNYSVVAEFVENENQMRVLNELGCQKYQGYLYSKALPYDELLTYLLRSQCDPVAINSFDALSLSVETITAEQ